MVFCCGGRHVVDDGGDVTEDGGVEQRRHDHHAQGERLLRVGVRGYVAEPDGGHAGHGEVERRHVHGPGVWSILYLNSDVMVIIFSKPARL